MQRSAVLLAALQGTSAAAPLSTAEAARVLGRDPRLRKSKSSVGGVVHELRARGVPVRTAKGDGYFLGAPCPALPPLPERAAARPLRLPASEAGRLRALWQAVLARAIEDAAGRVALEREKGQREAAVFRAAAWVGSRDFHVVCHLAGLDPEAVRDRLRRQGVAAVAERLTGLAC